jgi:amidohydrolase
VSTTETGGFDDAARELRDRLVSVRRELHAAAEVGLDLPRTQRILLRELDGLGLEITTGTSLTSVTAVLRGGRPGPTVLLRADMDALPIVEQTGLDFAAQDAMHACGHDLHMAGLLGAVRLLVERRGELPGTLVFMFQPGEEGYSGGRIMVDEGVLEASGERPVAAFAIHVDCATPAGAMVTREGAMMASVSAIRMTLTGTGGHAAFPHLNIDPVPVAAHLILAVQTFVTRRIAAAESAVLSITRLHSDSPAGNVLARTVSLEANVRTLSRETLELIRAELPSMLEAIAIAHGCTLDADFVTSYPVTWNDPAETRFALERLDARDAASVVRLPAPSMASEDFAYVLDEVPGELVFFGVEPAGGSGPLHSDTAVFDDGLLDTHAAILADLAWERLAAG